MQDGRDRTRRRRAPVKRTVRSDPEIVFVDLNRSLALLDAAEDRVPRLSAGDLVRVETMAGDPERQCRWRASRIATRIVLERAGGLASRNADFAIGPRGRPALADGLLHFNVSRSGNAMVVATSERAPVGVDLERPRGLAMTEDRRNRVIAAAANWAHWSPGDALLPNCDRDVLRAWVRLEATAKALGTGIGRLLTEEGVIGGEARPTEVGATRGLVVRDIEVPDGLMAAVAAGKLPTTLEIVTFPDRADALASFLGRSDS